MGGDWDGGDCGFEFLKGGERCIYVYVCWSVVRYTFNMNIITKAMERI